MLVFRCTQKSENRIKMCSSTRSVLIERGLDNRQPSKWRMYLEAHQKLGKDAGRLGSQKTLIGMVLKDTTQLYHPRGWISLLMNRACNIEFGYLAKATGKQTRNKMQKSHKEARRREYKYGDDTVQRCHRC